MFQQADPEGYRTALPGIQFKTMAYGERTCLTEFRMAAGSVVPRHAHPHEQTGYLVSGRIRFTSAGETFVAGPGDGWSFAGNQEHAAEILEDTVAVEVFSPVREDYLPGR